MNTKPGYKFPKIIIYLSQFWVNLGEDVSKYDVQKKCLPKIVKNGQNLAKIKGGAVAPKNRRILLSEYRVYCEILRTLPAFFIIEDAGEI